MPTLNILKCRAHIFNGRLGVILRQNFLIQKRVYSSTPDFLKMTGLIKLEERKPVFSDTKEARNFAETLTAAERRLLYDVLKKKTAEQYYDQRARDHAEVDTDTLVRIFSFNYMPHFATGAFQNSVMIAMGQLFDRAIGEHYGISVMAAAAVGNTVSNTLSLILHHYLQRLIFVYGYRFPVLSIPQKHTHIVRFSVQVARIIGLLSGSVVAMSLLLLYETPKRVYRKMTDKAEEDIFIEQLE